MTAAIIPFPSPAPTVPGQMSDIASMPAIENGEAAVLTGNALAFAQLVDALIGGNSLDSNDLGAAELDTAAPDEGSEPPETDTPEQAPAGCARPELVLSTLVTLPAPVPIAIPKIEQDTPVSPESGTEAPDAAIIVESVAAPVSPVASAVPVAATVEKGRTEVDDDAEQTDTAVDVDSKPRAMPVIAQPAMEVPVVAEPPAAVTPPINTPDAQPQSSPVRTEVATAAAPVTHAEASLQRQQLPQPLAFSLRLSKREPDAPAQPVTTGATARETAPEASIAPAVVETSEAVAPARTTPTAGTRAQANVRQSSTAQPEVEPSETEPRTQAVQTRSSSGEESKAAPAQRPVKAPAAVDTVHAQKEVTKTEAHVNAPPTAPPPDNSSRQLASSPEQRPAARAEIVEPTVTSRIDAVQPRTARDIVVQVPVEASRKVEVQVAEKAGEVRVSVHTADPELSQSLRSELGTLVSRLESAGYRAESLAPTESFVSSSSSARQDPPSSQQDASRGFSGQGQGSAGQGSNGQRRQHDEGNAWAEQFASSLTPEQDAGQENHPWQSVFNR